VNLGNLNEFTKFTQSIFD